MSEWKVQVAKKIRPKKKVKNKNQGGLSSPLKTAELLQKIRPLLNSGKYVFDPHADKRLIQRGIQPLQVLDILKGGLRHKPDMNEYSTHYGCWTYAVFGKNKEFELKIVIGFDIANMLIITVMKVTNR